MKLLHVVPTYVPAWRHGGPVRAVHGLCRALAAQGHEVAVFTTNVHGDSTLEVPLSSPVSVDGVRVTYFPVLWRRPYWAPALGRALRREIARFDLLHVHSVFTWPTSAAARAAEHTGVPYVVAPRGMLVPELLRRRGRLRKAVWSRLFERRTLGKAAAIHATSAVERDDLERLGWKLPAIWVAPNGIDAADADRTPADAVSPQIELAMSRGPFILFLGRLSWKKGLDRLVAALPSVPGARLVVAGNDEEGYTPRFEALIRDAGVADRVALVGEVHGADKAALLERAALLALPSHSENFGNVVLESLRAGRPVVVTPEVGLAALVRETDSGLVSDGESPALAAAMRRLIEEPALADAMGRRGREAVAARFGWPMLAREMAAAYTEILAGGRPSAPALAEAVR